MKTTGTMNNERMVTEPRKSPKVQTIGPTVLTASKIKCWHEGELVKLQVRDATLTFDHPTAFQVVEMLRYHAKQAKGFAGDTTTSWRTFAVLTDAEENDKRGF